MAGDFGLTAGQMLTIAVGCQGMFSFGGGGGTFVVAGSTPLLIAGGGGGPGGGGPGGAGQTTTSGADGGCVFPGKGGMNGNGGGGSGCIGICFVIGGQGAGGGGFLSAGGDANNGDAKGGQPFPTLTGGAGAPGGGNGGFGGGGGGGNGGGGGGGYSGGGGGGLSCNGGGGGSFISNAATNPSSSAGVNSRNGSVMITLLSVATTTVATTSLDIPFQGKIFPNLSAGDSIINIGNTGASSVLPPGGGLAIDGNLCVNVYVFSPDEQEVACCTCLVTPNGVVTTSARQLISKTLTPAVPTTVTVKLVASIGTAGATSCNAATPGTIMPGLIAFGTNLHAAPVGGFNSAGTYAVTETPFIPATLSAAELARITTLCGFIQSNGTGFGVCPGCSAGAAGGTRQ